MAVGPGGTLDVGCDDGGSVAAYATQPSFSGSQSTIPTATAGYTGIAVAANVDIAYGVALVTGLC